MTPRDGNGSLGNDSADSARQHPLCTHGALEASGPWRTVSWVLRHESRTSLAGVSPVQVLEHALAGRPTNTFNDWRRQRPVVAVPMALVGTRHRPLRPHMSRREASPRLGTTKLLLNMGTERHDPPSWTWARSDMIRHPGVSKIVSAGRCTAVRGRCDWWTGRSLADVAR